MKPRRYRKDDNIWYFKEIWSKWYFVFNGEVLMNAYDHEMKTKEKFLKLQSGSWFNVESCVFDSYSVFWYTAETNWIIYELSAADLHHIASSNLEVREALVDVEAKFKISWRKYDFWFSRCINTSNEVITKFRRHRTAFNLGRINLNAAEDSKSNNTSNLLWINSIK